MQLFRRCVTLFPFSRWNKTATQSLKLLEHTESLLLCDLTDVHESDTIFVNMWNKINDDAALHVSRLPLLAQCLWHRLNYFWHTWPINMILILSTSRYVPHIQTHFQEFESSKLLWGRFSRSLKFTHNQDQFRTCVCACMCLHMCAALEDLIRLRAVRRD